MLRMVIAALYRSVMKRIRRWGLPLFLCLLFITGGIHAGIGRFEGVSMIGLFTWHQFIGFMVILTMLTLAYDAWLGKDPSVDAKAAVSDRPESRIGGNGFLNGYDGWVNLCFYVLLGLTAAIGVLLYELKHLPWTELHRYNLRFRYFHALGGWLLLSLALVKYYLRVTRWLRQWVRYLRE